jgi:hypothetical protein
MSGGYQQVLPYFNEGFPVGRFKFVKKGETLGLKFDGLTKVNGRWVLMPKPWESLAAAAPQTEGAQAAPAPPAKEVPVALQPEEPKKSWLQNLFSKPK